MAGTPGAFEYRRVETDTLKGLKRAEGLQAKGWRIIEVRLFSLVFERLKKGRIALGETID